MTEGDIEKKIINGKDNKNKAVELVKKMIDEAQKEKIDHTDLMDALEIATTATKLSNSMMTDPNPRRYFEKVIKFAEDGGINTDQGRNKEMIDEVFGLLDKIEDRMNKPPNRDPEKLERFIKERMDSGQWTEKEAQFIREIDNQYNESPEYSKMTMGRLVGETVGRLQREQAFLNAVHKLSVDMKVSTEDMFRAFLLDFEVFRFEYEDKDAFDKVMEKHRFTAREMVREGRRLGFIQWKRRDL